MKRNLFFDTLVIVAIYYVLCIATWTYGRATMYDMSGSTFTKLTSPIAIYLVFICVYGYLKIQRYLILIYEELKSRRYHNEKNNRNDMSA